MENIVKIAVPVPIAKLLDYLVPTDNRILLQPGQRVLVPFKNKEMVGIIFSIEKESDWPAEKLKRFIRCLDEKPLLPKSMLQFLFWASQYYHHPIGEVVESALPTALRKVKPATVSTDIFWRVTDLGKQIDCETLSRAKRQQMLLQKLQKNLQGLSQKTIQRQGFSSTIIHALSEKEYITKCQQEKPPEIVNSVTEPSHQLTAEQQQALTSIEKSLDQFSVFLLQGVTSSGKTEVYLQLIKQILARGQRALVLVPEIGLTPQLVARFQRRFVEPIVVLHSNLNESERLNSWLWTATGKVDILIGTRSAIFTPIPNLGAIIIDESHDLSFKQQDGFHYSARDLAIKRASDENIPIVMGSATPTLETLYNVERGRYTVLHLTARAGNATEPTYHLIDIRNKKLNEGLSAPLLELVQQHLQANQQVLFFLNRRGYAPVLICHQCGWVANCHRCDAKMTLHLQPRSLHCHHCCASRKVDSHCPQCGSTQLTPVGIGTERLEQVLAKLFPEYPVVRIDRDTTQRKGMLTKKLDEINRGEAKILIGTQMLAKGHHFPNVTLVALLDIDSSFYSSDFRASERMAQLLTQVAGRSGRAEKAGCVAIQTRNPDNYLLTTLLQQGYIQFVEAIATERKSIKFPPYSHMALLRADAYNRETVQQFLLDIKKNIAENNFAVHLLGPIPAPMERKKNRFRAQLLLQADERHVLHLALDALTAILSKATRTQKLRWSLDIDPQEMF